MTTGLSFSAIGRSPIQCVADWLRGGRGASLPSWMGGPSWEDGRFVFTDSGSSAIALAARLWDLGNGDEVLVPSYNCGSEISPLAATGARIVMYRVDGRTRIDPNDLLGRLTARTRVVYVTHYFGWPADLGALVVLCRARGIKLLEDCALSLFSAGTGCEGDAVIFSLRKSLPAPGGGVLFLRCTSETPVNLPGPLLGATARGIAQQLESWLARSIGLSRPHRVTGRAASTVSETSIADLPASYYRASNVVPRRGSRFAIGLLDRTDHATVVSRRRNNYTHLRTALMGTRGVTFLSHDAALPAGLCPLGLPILVEDKPRWVRGLSLGGVFVSPWWSDCHRDLDWGPFPEALKLKAQLVLLPVHQELTARDMDDVARVARALAGGRT